MIAAARFSGKPPHYVSPKALSKILTKMSKNMEFRSQKSKLFFKVVPMLHLIQSIPLPKIDSLHCSQSWKWEDSQVDSTLMQRSDAKASSQYARFSTSLFHMILYYPVITYEYDVIGEQW